jgi:hypothetical protein
MKNAPTQTKDQSAVTGFHFNTRGTLSAIDWQAYALGEYRIECPRCGRGGRDKTLGLTIKTDTSLAHCFRCEFVETYKAGRESFTRGPTFKPQRTPSLIKHESLSQWGRDLWTECRALDGLALEYLAYRRCVIPPKESDLRWHQRLKHPSGYTGPALVGLVTDATTGEPLSLHRTWITPTGKALVNPPRMHLANHSIKNGCIRLWPDKDVKTELAIAEGIETALSLAHGLTPVWSVTDAGHMAKFPVISSVETLTIAADNDSAGLSAANKCASHWVSHGKRVRVTRQHCNDINDLIMEVSA